ncbi:hypothetical protein [Bradyrhizobium sp. CCBAU 53421]|uniref:hypothetical protein n=1 Tax=Bradyrhizobium sp. CCBAU 53421 TaxID=1325120 RepID=UPI001FED73C7|nr:hypothetical protein [Bradyrhizobium sp. CCBAU 53421]
MRFIRLILFDLALMLLAPDVAEAMNVGTAALFILVTEAVAPFKPIAGPEAASSSGDSRHLYSQTTQALPVQPADNRRPAKLAEDSATLDSRLACVIGMRARQRSIATILNGTETLKVPAVATPSICNAARAFWPPRGGDAALEPSRMDCRRHGDHRLCGHYPRDLMARYSIGAGR